MFPFLCLLPVNALEPGLHTDPAGAVNVDNDTLILPVRVFDEAAARCQLHLHVRAAFLRSLQQQTHIVILQQRSVLLQ